MQLQCCKTDFFVTFYDVSADSFVANSFAAVLYSCQLKFFAQVENTC